MAKILCIDTATEVCSVAIVSKDEVLKVLETPIDKSHAAKLAVFIDQALKECQLEVKELAAIAVSIGPGSYTGLRIGVSTAKGLAYGAKLPVIAVPTLDAMAWSMIEGQNDFGDSFLCPMIDARRMEVYTGMYDAKAKPIKETEALVVEEDSFDSFFEQGPIIFFGTGAAKFEGLFKNEKAHFHLDYSHSAASMRIPAFLKFDKKEFEDVAYFEPFYLKDFITTTPKKNILFPKKKA